jgi:DNA mismatch repair protein MutL
VDAGEEKNILDGILEQLKHGASAGNSRPEMMLKHLARRVSQNKQAVMQPEMQQALIDELFGCAQPEYAPDGKKVFTILKTEDIEKLVG